MLQVKNRTQHAVHFQESVAHLWQFSLILTIVTNSKLCLNAHTFLLAFMVSRRMTNDSTDKRALFIPHRDQYSVFVRGSATVIDTVGLRTFVRNNINEQQRFV